MKEKRTTYSKRDLGRSFGLTVCVMLVAQMLLTAIFAPFYDDNGKLSDAAYWAMQAIYCVITGSVSFFYAKASRTDFLSATTANRKLIFSHIVWGFAADLCLISLMIPLNVWLTQWLEKITGNSFSVDVPMQVVPMILIACVLPALCEEFTFRGTIAQSLRNTQTGGGKIGALAISGALFAVVHFNPAQTIHQFVLGALLALLMFRSGSVWTSVVVHLFNNFVVVALSFLFTDESVLVPYFRWMFGVGMAGFALCVFGYVSTTKSRWIGSAEAENSQNLQYTVDKSDFEGNLFLLISACVCVLIWVATLLIPQ